jgi:prepilin-type processing-associated H-X9-DG protein
MLVGGMAVVATKIAGRSRVAESSGTAALLRWTIDARVHAWEGRVATKHDADRTVLVSLGSQNVRTLPLGWRVAVVAEGRDFERLSLFPAEVRSVSLEGVAELGLGPVAFARVAEEADVAVLAPPDLPASGVAALPPWAPLRRRGEPGEDAVAKSLHDIGSAFRAYVADHGTLPPGALIGPDGHPWHSWRVLLLPYLGAEELYDRYRFGEPWNGDHNARLVPEMPEAYAGTARSRQGGRTAVLGFTGPGTLLPHVGPSAGHGGEPEWDLGAGVGPLPTDGSSFTLLARTGPEERSTPWTSPNDLDASTVGVGSAGGRYLFADGHVERLRDGTPDDVLRALVTPSGSEDLDLERWRVAEGTHWRFTKLAGTDPPEFEMEPVPAEGD